MSETASRNLEREQGTLEKQMMIEQTNNLSTKEVLDRWKSIAIEKLGKEKEPYRLIDISMDGESMTNMKGTTSTIVVKTPPKYTKI